MKALSGPMTTHLQGEVTSLCACWHIARVDGTIMGFTDHDADIVYNGVTYKAETGFFRSAISNTSTLAPDELTVNGMLDSAAITEIDVRAGLYDYAEVSLFMVNWMDLSMGQVNLRYGHFGEASMTPTGAYKIELRGLVETVQQTVGQTIAPECNADLGDNRCKKVTVPSLRQSLCSYGPGMRVLFNSISGDKMVALPIENNSFGAVYATDLADWTLSNVIISDGNAQAGSFCVEATDWIGSISQQRSFMAAFSSLYEDGAIVQASIYLKAAQVYQQSRLCVSFRDSTNTEIGNLYSDYASPTSQYPATGTQLTLTGRVPVGTESCVFKVQTTKLNTPTNPPTTPWDSSYATFIDTASLKITIGGTPTEMLLENGFEISSSSATRTAGWTPSTANTLLSVTSWFQMTSPNAGGYFLVMEEGNGLSGTQTSSCTSGEISLATAGGISSGDIDTGLFEIVTTWEQANAGEQGTAGIGLTFYDASNALLQSIAPVLKQINPWMEWQFQTQVNLVPVGARYVKYTVTYGMPPGSNVTSYPQSSITDINGTLQHVGVGQNVNYSQYSGVEYECTSPGVTANSTPSGWSTTLGATIVDGGVTWTVVHPLWTMLGTVSASPTSRSIFNVTGFTSPGDQFFQWGTCEFLTGQNAGIIREVITQVGLAITLMMPPPFPVASGDLVALAVGCDHTVNTCNAKFGNIVNYRGWPAVPGTDQYFQVANPTGGG